MSKLETDPSPIARRGQVWPRVIGAVALIVLGVCGATLLVIPPRPASLISRSNWDLATALPSYRDFPADWNYSLEGTVRRAPPANNAAPRAQAPASVYTPAKCQDIPKIVRLYQTASFAALVHVDRNTADIASATLLSSDEPEPNARFIIWPVPDGAALIANYQDWLGRCGSYRITSADADSQTTDVRIVTTTVDARSADGTDAAVAVTRSSMVTAVSRGPSSTYRVMYYAVRGVLLECATNLEDADVGLVKRLAAQTLQKLRTL